MGINLDATPKSLDMCLKWIDNLNFSELSFMAIDYNGDNKFGQEECDIEISGTNLPTTLKGIENMLEEGLGNKWGYFAVNNKFSTGFEVALGSDSCYTSLGVVDSNSQRLYRIPLSSGLDGQNFGGKNGGLRFVIPDGNGTTKSESFPAFFLPRYISGDKIASFKIDQDREISYQGLIPGPINK